MTTENDQIVAALKRLDPTQLSEIWGQVTAAQIAEVKATAAAKAETHRILKIHSYREKRNAMFLGTEGELKRMGIAIDDITSSNIDKLLAATAPSETLDRYTRDKWVNKKMALKANLHRLGLLD